MKTKDLINLFTGLQQCFEIKEPVFRWKASLNYMTLLPMMEQYNEQLEKLQLQHAKMQDDKPVIVDNLLQFKDEEAYLKDKEKLDNTELEITLHKIRKIELPTELTMRQLVQIGAMVHEFNE
ncbi:MAG TPA: hypothetical protein GXX72_08970 [Clostridiaceae bacterium]|nr:hypothetical protein [Clostridiaceae bacterium]